MIICADDFGLAQANDAAIIALARAGRVSAVSVMTAVGRHVQMAADLAELHHDVDIGLHLVFTDEGKPLAGIAGSLTARDGEFYAFRELVRRAYTGRIRAADVRMEIQAQIAAFHACFGRPPDHLDGHLHVQQLPVICEEVAVAAAGLCRTAPCYVRHTWLPLTKLLREGGFKRAAIAIPAGRLRRSLLHAAVPTNSGFYGVYDYRRWQNFPVWFEGFRVAARRVNDIIMVHPGFVEPWRRLEYDTLNSASELRPNRFRHAAQA